MGPWSATFIRSSSKPCRVASQEFFAARCQTTSGRRSAWHLWLGGKEETTTTTWYLIASETILASLGRYPEDKSSLWNKQLDLSFLQAVGLGLGFSLKSANGAELAVYRRRCQFTSSNNHPKTPWLLNGLMRFCNIYRILLRFLKIGVSPNHPAVDLEIGTGDLGIRFAWTPQQHGLGKSRRSPRDGPHWAIFSPMFIIWLWLT